MIQIQTDQGMLFINMDRALVVRVLEAPQYLAIEVVGERGVAITGSIKSPAEGRFADIMAALNGDE